MRISRPATLSLRTVALLYLALILLLPLGVVLFRTFEHGIGIAWGWMTISPFEEKMARSLRSSPSLP